MIIVLTCHCHGAEVKARKALMDAGVQNYMTTPIYVGPKTGSLVLNNMPDEVKETLDWKGLYRYINEASSYSVIAGFDEQVMRWVEVKKKDLISRADAANIVEIFA